MKNATISINNRLTKLFRFLLSMLFQPFTNLTITNPDSFFNANLDLTEIV